MFCGKCGFKNEEGAEFCAQCGEKIDLSTDTRNELLQEKDINNKNRKIGKIVVFLMVLIVVIIAVSVIHANNYKGVIKTYIKATFEPDENKIIGLIPNEMFDYIIEDGDYTNKEECSDDLRKVLQNGVDDIEEIYGDHWKYSYEILDIKTIKKSELEEIKNKYKELDVKVSSAKKVETKITVEVGDIRKTSTTVMIYLIKIRGSWYLDLFSMNLSM